MSTKPRSEVEIDPEMDPETSEVTRPSDLGFPTVQDQLKRQDPRYEEIEVEPVRQPSIIPDENDMVEIRMAKDIEEFTYGNPHRAYHLEEGKRYRVPREIAAYLWDLGYVHTR